ncbi:MAG TPA: GntR family transcriptional regulator [Streptomyces sp.]
MGADTSGNAKASKPNARQIAADLRAQIARGDYRPGQQLPSTAALQKTYGVANQTVQNAFNLLHQQGITEGRAGAGVFVRERPTVQRRGLDRLRRANREAGQGAFLGDARYSGFTATSKTEVTFEPADERTAAALDIAVGDEVVVRSRVMSADDVPVQIATSRLPRSITAGSRIEQIDTGPSGSYGVLDELGHQLQHGVEYVSTRPATADEATLLRIQPGAPVFEVTRIAFTVAGRPVEINSMVMNGERYQLVYEVPLD